MTQTKYVFHNTFLNTCNVFMSTGQLLKSIDISILSLIFIKANIAITVLNIELFKIIFYSFKI